MKMIIILYTIVTLLYWPVDSRQCYDCYCDYDWATSTGSCSSTTFQSDCILREFDNQYCKITNIYVDNYELRYFLSVAPDFYQDSHFFEAVETITLSNTTWLPTTISSISYGCDWDGCNHPSISEYLPESFQMNIDQSVLNSQLLNGQSPAQTCYTCSTCINSITPSLCQQVPCTNGICYIDEIHNYVVTPANNCTYYFASTCQPFTTPVQPPSVRIRAIYYIDLPAENQLEIDEVDIRCTKDLCNSIEIVEELKGQLQTTINLNPDFQPSTTTTTVITTTTMTSPDVNTAIAATLHSFLYFILVLLLL